MTQITISNDATTVTMPRTKKVTDAGVLEYKEVTMASGKKVREIIGFRPGFTYEWDYVPAVTISEIITMLRGGRAFTVNYFDLDGTDKSGEFLISYPALKTFKFKDGIAVWHDCKITISAQEVT